MARLRYLSNARTGSAGTICNGDLTVTGDITVTGSYTYGSGSLPLSQNLQGTFVVGQNDTGYDVKFYGAGSGKYWLWDESANGVVLVGTTSHTGILTMEGTSKLHFHDSGGGEYIYASADNALALAGGSTITLTSTTIVIAGAITSTGKHVISPGGTGSYIDFALETEWVSGTLINADSAGGGVTFSGAVLGMLLDFDTNITAASGHNVKGYQVKLPDLDTSSSTTFIGFDLPTAGAIDTSSSATFNWKGVNIQLPDITDGGTATNSYGLYVGAGSYTSGNEYGVYITGVQTGVAIAGAVVAGITISGANAIGITMAGTYSTAAINIATTFASYADYAIYIAGTTASTGGTNNPLYVSSIPTASGVIARAAEFLLAPTAKMGAWGNAVKAYLNMTGASGSTGLLSGLLAEILLPDEQMTGTFAALELEISAPSSFVSSEGTGNNCVSFINIGLSGSNKGEIDEHGLFLTVSGLTSGTGELLYNNTLKCSIGTTEWFLPFSSAEGTYTSAYPVVLTNATAVDITSTITTASTYPFSVDATLATNKSTGGFVAAYFNATLTADTELTSTAGYRTIRSILEIEGDGSTTILSSEACFSAVEGRYYTDGAAIEVSNGIHCALAGLMKAGDNYVISAAADYCGLAIIDSTHADATIEDTKYSGIFIGNVAPPGAMGNAIKVGARVTNFLEILDEDTIASLDANQNTAGDPDGWLRISIGGQTCWIYTYLDNPTE